MKLKGCLRIVINKKVILFICICIVSVIFGIFIALIVGAKNIPLATVWESFFNFNNDLDMSLIRDIRLPRALATAIVGGLLGTSGAMMQGVTRNPVAEPSLMGITQGATLAIAIFYATSSANSIGLIGSATLGATISGILILLFSMKNTRVINVSKLLLAGTALSVFFISLASVVGILSNRSQSLAFWISGGFRTADWQSVKLLFITSIICFALSILISNKINILSLGEDIAIGLGEKPGFIRIVTLVLIIPMCAVSVAVAGNIAFVGLIIPHIVRKIIGVDYKHIIPASFALGAALLVWADIAARMINVPYETPIGLFTSLFGIPFFIWLIRKEFS